MSATLESAEERLLLQNQSDQEDLIHNVSRNRSPSANLNLHNVEEEEADDEREEEEDPDEIDPDDVRSDSDSIEIPDVPYENNIPSNATLPDGDRDRGAAGGGSGGVKLRHRRKSSKVGAGNSNHQQHGTTTQDEDEGAAAAPPSASGSKESKGNNEAFECNICLDSATDAVVSMCGHLFCWPCLHQWLETRPDRQICPVCKAAISKDKVIPLYGRGNTEQKDPREKAIPPRPRGQRTEPENGGGGLGFGLGGPGGGFFAPFGQQGGGGGIQMSFGIGAFPFGIFSTNFNLGNGMNNNNNNNGEQTDEERFLNQVFLWIAFAFVFWLLIA